MAPKRQSLSCEIADHHGVDAIGRRLAKAAGEIGKRLSCDRADD
jgi:hypothetical protein